MKSIHILILLLSMVVAGCVSDETRQGFDKAKVYYHEGCEYLKFNASSQNSAIHSHTCPNHPVKLLSAEGSGWLMPGEVFEFYSEDGSRMIIEAEDILYDEIDEDEIYLEVTGKGFTLHVSANL